MRSSWDHHMVIMWSSWGHHVVIMGSPTHSCATIHIFKLLLRAVGHLRRYRLRYDQVRHLGPREGEITSLITPLIAPLIKSMSRHLGPREGDEPHELLFWSLYTWHHALCLHARIHNINYYNTHHTICCCGRR